MKNAQQQSAWQRLMSFLSRGQWLMRDADLPPARRCGLHALRFASLVAIGFRRSQCSLHAASLTFFSLMALVPVLVLALAMARTFGGADLARAQLDGKLDAWMGQMEQSVVASAMAEGREPGAHADSTRAFARQFRELADQLHEQVDRINFATLGGIGLLLLIWTVISVLGKVEASFNQVWGVKQARPVVRKFADYLSVILLLPFLITAVSTVPVAGMVVEVTGRTVGGLTAEGLRAILESRFLKNAITLLLGTLTFAFFLGFMPNTRVRTVPALIGGVVTMVLFAAWLRLCAMLQIGIAKYSALYGGFAVVPILLLWVYTSWQIILLGAEIAFSAQNRDTYMREQHAAAASPRSRLLLALALCAGTARHAREAGGGPFSAAGFAREQGIPVRFARDMLDNLVRVGVLAEVAGRPGEYLLCRCGSSLATGEVARRLLDDGEAPDSLGLDRLAPTLQAFNAALDACLAERFAGVVADL